MVRNSDKVLSATLGTIRRLFLVSTLLFSSSKALAQTPGKDDSVAIIELGGAAGISLRNGAASFGPNIALEVTPIENWLELEMGTTPLFRRHHSAEWDTDLLFKKPWKLSEKVEFMAGIGPEWVNSPGRANSKSPGTRVNSIEGEAVLDFMFWPGSKRRLGWFVEPAYDYSFTAGHEQSFGITGGLLIAIR